MVTAMVYPELIAAICPIDGNWPGERVGPSEVDYADIRPMALAMSKRSMIIGCRYGIHMGQENPHTPYSGEVHSSINMIFGSNTIIFL